MAKSICLLLLIAMSGLEPASPIEVEFVGTYALETMGISERNATDIVVSGTTGYLTTDFSVEIIDLSDIQHPEGLSSVDLPRGIDDFNEKMFKAGNVLLVCMFGEDVAIINVEDRSAPFLASTLQTDGEAQDIDVKGHTAYIADASDGLLAVDIISASSPVVIAQIKDYGGASGLKMVGEYLYVGFEKYPYQLAVFSSSSGVPGFINSIPVPYVTGGMELIPPSTLFARSFSFVDISNPGVPRLTEDRIHGLDWGLQVTDFVADERYIYFVGSAAIPDDLYIDGFLVLDAINSTHEMVGEWLRFGDLQFSGLDRRGDLMFIADGTRGLTILRVEQDSGVQENSWHLYR